MGPMPTMFEESRSAGVSAGAADSQYVQPTLSHGLRIWWAFYWRTTVASAILVAALILTIKPLFLKGGLSFPAYRSLMAVGPWFITYAVSIPVMYFILRKRFQHFRIGLLSLSGGVAAGEIPPTFPRTLRIWWTFTWRTIVYRLILGFVGNIALGFVLGMLSGIFPRMQGTFTFVMGVLIEGAAGLFVIYSNILDEDFSTFRVALLPRTAAAPVAAALPTAAIPPAAT
jgi:hypothetical protein